jgi:hypothetical protein
VVKRRRNAGNLGAAPAMPSPSGPNAGMASPTISNVSSTNLSKGNGTNGRPQ